MILKINKRGFTLIEILVVMTLIGIVFLMISLSTQLTRSDEFKLKELSYQIYNLMLLIQDLAIIEGKYYGVVLDQADIAVYELRENSQSHFKWINAELPNRLKKVKFSESIKFTFLSDLNKKARSQFNFNLTPNLIFYPTGMVTEFKLKLQSKQNQQWSNLIFSQKNGNIVIKLNNDIALRAI